MRPFHGDGFPRLRAPPALPRHVGTNGANPQQASSGFDPNLAVVGDTVHDDNIQLHSDAQDDARQIKRGIHHEMESEKFVFGFSICTFLPKILYLIQCEMVSHTNICYTYRNSNVYFRN